MLSNLNEKCIVDAAETGILHYLDHLGLTVDVGWDFSRFPDLVENTYGWINPTFDPACKSIHPHSFWVALRDGPEKVVSIQATAYYAEGDFESAIRTGSLYFDPEQLPDDYDRIEVQPMSRLIEGPYTHGGATWVAPEWRGLYLAHHITALSRILIFRYMNVRWFTGLFLENIRNRTVPTAAYDYPEDGIDMVLQGYYPVNRRLVRLYACHMDRQTALQRLSAHLMSRPSKLPVSAETPAVHLPQ